ncbi:WYL domain-containing protein [Paenibacillus ihumii]|uniref:WYL domain-containing protein n=1 Tax=Paenibacillus ihumii TaxID=687436 RepID=UPI0006D7AD89|nr:WYL domain-containing protein [Paenibacillus ihumii]
MEPGRLFWERGSWYPEGYCLSRLAPRLFRLSRMRAIQEAEETFQPSGSAAESSPDLLPLEFRLKQPTAEPRESEQFAGECR